MTNLTKEEYARLHLKAKRGMLTAEERAALEAYEAAAQPAPQTPVPADTETLLCCPYCGHATITTQIVSDVTYRKPATVIAMMFAPLIAVVLAFLLRNMFVTVLALIVVIVSALVPMWAFYRGNYSVTHKYYVRLRCSRMTRSSSDCWKGWNRRFRFPRRKRATWCPWRQTWRRLSVRYLLWQMRCRV